MIFKDDKWYIKVIKVILPGVSVGLGVGMFLRYIEMPLPAKFGIFLTSFGFLAWTLPCRYR